MPNPGDIVATLSCPPFPAGIVAFRLIDGYYSMSEDGENFIYLAPVSVTSNVINPPSDYDIQQAFLPNYGINYGLSADGMTLLNDTFAAHSGTNGQGDGEIFYVSLNKNAPNVTPLYFKISKYRYSISFSTTAFQDIGQTLPAAANVFYIGPPTNNMIQTVEPNYYLATGNAEAQLQTQAFWDHSGIAGSGDGSMFSVNVYYDESSIIQTDIVVATGAAPPAGAVAFMLLNKHYYMSTDGINFKYLGVVIVNFDLINPTIYPIPDFFIQQVFPTYGINYGLSTDGITFLNNTFATHSGESGSGDGVIFYVAANSATPKMSVAYFKISGGRYYISSNLIGPFSDIGAIVPTYLGSLWVEPVTNAMIQTASGFSDYYLGQSTVESQLGIQSFAARSGALAQGDNKVFPLIVYYDPAPVIQNGIEIVTGTAPTEGTAKFMMMNNSYYMSIDGVNFSNIGSPLNNFEYLRGDLVLIYNLDVYPPSDTAIESVFPGYGIHYGLSTDGITELNNTFNGHKGTDNKGDGIIFEVEVTTDTPPIVEVYFKMENGKYYISTDQSCCFVELYDILVKGDISGPYCPTDSQIQTSALFTNYSLPMSYVDVIKRRIDFMDHSDIVLVGDYTVTSGVLFKGDGVVFSEYMYTGKIAASNKIIIPDGVAPSSGQAAFMIINNIYYMSTDGVDFLLLGDAINSGPLTAPYIPPPSDFAIQQVFPNYGINYGLSDSELTTLNNTFRDHSGILGTGDNEIFTVNVNKATPVVKNLWFIIVNYQWYASMYENCLYTPIGVLTGISQLNGMIQSVIQFSSYFIAPGRAEYLSFSDKQNGYGGGDGAGNSTPFSLHVYQDMSFQRYMVTTIPMTGGIAISAAEIAFIVIDGYYFLSTDGKTYDVLGPIVVSDGKIYPPSDYLIQQKYSNYGINYGLSDSDLAALNTTFNSHSGSLGIGDGKAFPVSFKTDVPTVVDAWFKIENSNYFMSLDPAYGFTNIGAIVPTYVASLYDKPVTNEMIQKFFPGYELAAGFREVSMQTTYFSANSGTTAQGNGITFTLNVYKGDESSNTNGSITKEDGIAPVTGEASFLMQDSNYYMSTDGINFKWLGPVTTNSNLIYPVSDYLIQQVFPNYGINYELSDDELTGLNSAFTVHSGTDGKGDGVSFNVSVNTAVPKVVNAWFKMENTMYYVSLDSSGDNFVQIGVVAPQYLASVNAKAPSDIQIQASLYNYYAAMGYVEYKLITETFYARSGLFRNGSLLPSGDGIQFSVHLYSGAVDQVYG